MSETMGNKMTKFVGLKIWERIIKYSTIFPREKSEDRKVGLRTELWVFYDYSIFMILFYSMIRYLRCSTFWHTSLLKIMRSNNHFLPVLRTVLLLLYRVVRRWRGARLRMTSNIFEPCFNTDWATRATL